MGYIQYERRECKCSICVKMCKTSPCFPDPVGALRLIHAGYKDKLVVSWWKSTLHGMEFMWPVIAPIQTENGCIFLKNNLCELHNLGLKPIEGQIAYHNVDGVKLRKGVCFTWVNHMGIIVMKMFENSKDAVTVLETLNQNRI